MNAVSVFFSLFEKVLGRLQLGAGKTARASRGAKDPDRTTR